MQVALLTLLNLVGALNVGGNVRLFTDFSPAYPLVTSLVTWDLDFGALITDYATGQFVGDNSTPKGIKSEIPYCLSEDYVLQMSAKIQYNSTLMTAPSTIQSSQGWREDPYFACGWFGGYNSDGWRFQFLLTNTKVYAVYAHFPATKSAEGAKYDPSQPINYIYVIPIANRAEIDVNTYSINLKRSTYDASWRIDNVEKLLIRNVGQTIAKKFLVWSDATTNLYSETAFPDALYVQLGIGTITDLFSIGLPNTVCQGTLFDFCNQSILTAPRTFCKYGQTQGNGYDIDMVMNVDDIFVARIGNVEHCGNDYWEGTESSASRWWTRY